MSALSAAADAAWRELEGLVATVPADERAEMIAASSRGLRGYDGKVFHTLVPAHWQSEDARGLLGDAAQASGIIASRAMSAEAAGEISMEASAGVCKRAVQLAQRMIAQPVSLMVASFFSFFLAHHGYFIILLSATMLTPFFFFVN